MYMIDLIVLRKECLIMPVVPDVWFDWFNALRGGQFMDGSAGINIDSCTDVDFYWWVRYL